MTARHDDSQVFTRPPRHTPPVRTIDRMATCWPPSRHATFQRTPAGGLTARHGGEMLRAIVE